MKALITGACGFVGPYLSRRLAKDNTEVLGLGLSRDACIEGRYTQCDILDFPLLKQTISDFQPDRVFHLAGLVHPAESQEHPRDYYRVNVQGTVNLLEALRLVCPQARLLFVSSSEVYGGSFTSSTINEESAPKPLNHYAASKLLAEQAALQYRQQNDLWTAVARPFNHSGPGQSPGFVISDFCRQIADAEMRTPAQSKTIARLEVGNLSAEKDFLDVRDVVDAYVKLIERGADGEIYNICSGKGTIIREILDTAVRLSRVDIEVEISEKKFRPLQFPRQVGDNTKLHRTIDWKPRYDLEATISDIIEYWRKSLRNRIKPTIG